MKTTRMKLRTALLGFLLSALLTVPTNSAAVMIASAGNVTVETGITKEERARLVQYLQDVNKQFLSELTKLSDAQWTFKTNDKSWSAADITEHLVSVEGFVYANLTEKILKAPQWMLAIAAHTERHLLQILELKADPKYPKR